MRLKELELYQPFRGLQKGFHISFTRPLQKINSVEPFCLVGLNGSGKSNLMQLLAEIFFHLEFYVLPQINFYMADDELAFRISYELPVSSDNFIQSVDTQDYLSHLKTIWRHVVVTKQANKPPVFEFGYNGELQRASLPKQELGKLLPAYIIGYSSGMNELISNPFIKMDFHYLDSLKKKAADARKQPDESTDSSGQETPLPATEDFEFNHTTNRLFYLDYHSNAMMMLANFLSRKKQAGKQTELDIVNTIVGIEDIISFKITINLRIKQNYFVEHVAEAYQQRRQGVQNQLDVTTFFKDLENEIPRKLKNIIDELVNCSTTCKIAGAPDLEGSTEIRTRLEMYFMVDDEMKRAFMDRFRGEAKDLFRQFYLLNLINIESYSDELKGRVIAAGLDDNIPDMLPKLVTTDKVFHIDEIKLRKKNGQQLLYRQLSDGEHQYLQVAGSLMLMAEDASLFLMDEPETHFNPEWRSKLISSLNEIVDRKMDNDIDYTLALKNYQEKIITKEEFDNRKEKYFPKQEIILTTHSPFVVSDCQTENVYIFKRSKTEGVHFRKPEIKTYGTSSHILLKELFNIDDTIATITTKTIDKLEDEVKTADTPEKLQTIKASAEELGESVEKFMLMYAINTKMKQLS